MMRVLRKLERSAGPLVYGALLDQSITEIILNEDGRLWAEYLGKGMTHIGELSEAAAMSLVSSVSASLNMVVTPEAPIVEGELGAERARFEALIPPVVRRPVFCIRKHTTEEFDISAYRDRGALTDRHHSAIENAVVHRKNIIVSGGTGSGKTTLARAILRSIASQSPDHRIVIIEDTLELNHVGENYVSLKVSSGANAQALLRATMRLRPDRIVVGEVRGGEALTLLKAWNTGHPGGVSTIHANSARSALTRLEQLIAEVSVTPIPHVIGDAVDLIVHIERSPDDGMRRIVEVLSVDGYQDGNYLATQI